MNFRKNLPILSGGKMKKLVDRYTVNPIPTQDIVPVRAGYQQCSPGWTFEPSCRDSFTVQYVTSGCGVIYKDGETFPVHEKEAFILRPGETFQLQADVSNPWTYIWIGFRTTLDLPELYTTTVFPAQNLENLFLKIANCNKMENFPLEPLLLSYIWEFIFRMRQMHTDVVHGHKKAEEYVEQACQLIQSHYATMNVNQLADYLHLNRCYLSRIFKQFKGISIKSYWTNTRLQAGRNLILQNYTVAQASSMVGYADIASFSRAFKEYYKYSPKQYAQMHQKKSGHILTKENTISHAQSKIFKHEQEKEKKMKKTGFLFDLDGVIVDTAKYHYLAWKKLAEELGIPFTIEDNERLKGVSRLQSFEIILEIGKRTMTDEEKEFYCTKKNDIYVDYIKKLEKDEVLPGVRDFLITAREMGIPMALGSASKNAVFILERLDLMDLLDEIVDGTLVSAAKPDPEVFLKGAEMLSLKPEECIVFEDSTAGIEAAHRGNMKAMGVGLKENLPEADNWITGFEGLTPRAVLEMFNMV